ncbi:MAG: hypothetical protein LUD41_07760 [Phascolarctobacterium sp.]|nr:hypothetical protein [Phascolarctobacterium sp.]
MANEADCNGGDINNASGAQIGSISYSYFMDNEAVGEVGAIWNRGTIGRVGDDGNFVDESGISNCYFVGNIALSDEDWNATVDNGVAGAIYNSGTITGISDSYFAENWSMEGGTIFNYQNTDESSDRVGIIVSITNCSFVENVGDSGGATRNDYGVIGDVTTGEGGIENCYFIRNSTDSTSFLCVIYYGYGGAIRIHCTITVITESYFVENKTVVDKEYKDSLKEYGMYGGAIFNQSYIGMAEVDGEVAKVGYGIKNTVFQDNEATRGGAIYNGSLRSSGVTVTDGDYTSIISNITGCTFYGNVGVLYGGAIYNYADGAIWEINSNSFLYNEARGGNGGAIENAESYAMIGSITNNYFLWNEVDTRNHGGGAIYNNGGTIGGTAEIYYENGNKILSNSGSSISGNYF